MMMLQCVVNVKEIRNMNQHVVHVYGLALHEFPIAQVDRAPPGVWEVIGSNPVGDSDFFSVPRS